MRTATAASPSRARRQRNARGQGVRLTDEIVSGALALIEREGTDEAVTLRAVAREVGIAAPSIYPHFPDRDAIVLAVVARLFDELTEAIQAGLTAAGEGAAREGPAGSGTAGPDAAGPDAAGSDAAGSEAAGSDAAGPDAAGSDAAGPDAAGPDAAGPDAAGRLVAGCQAYVAFGLRHPARYGVLFSERRLTAAQASDYCKPVPIGPDGRPVPEFGAESFALLLDAVEACVRSGVSASTDVVADATAIWVALHGTVTLRTALPGFPWPPTDEFVRGLALSLARIPEGAAET